MIRPSRRQVSSFSARAFASIVGAALAMACGGSATDGGEGAAGSGGGGSGGASGAAGSSGSGGDPGACSYAGASYDAGESFPAGDGCNTCSCGADGSVGCTLRACLDGCVHQGVEYPAGTTFPAGDGCNDCTCQDDGAVICTRLACGPFCEFNGETYIAGERFMVDCNECVCTDSGKIDCTTIACGGCTYAGQYHAKGTQFPSLDGCNTCTCTSVGVSCTEKACPCDPKAEWWRGYVALDPNTCAVIDFGCPDNTVGFENACGCGCEQNSSCPETFDCMPPSSCDEEELRQKCPYSGIAY